jgi:hypothetical protein
MLLHHGWSRISKTPGQRVDRQGMGPAARDPQVDCGKQDFGI